MLFEHRIIESSTRTTNQLFETNAFSDEINNFILEIKLSHITSASSMVQNSNHYPVTNLTQFETLRNKNAKLLFFTESNFTVHISRYGGLLESFYFSIMYAYTSRDDVVFSPYFKKTDLHLIWI